MTDHNHDERYVPAGWNIFFVLFLFVLLGFLCHRTFEAMQRTIDRLELQVNSLTSK